MRGITVRGKRRNRKVREKRGEKMEERAGG